MRFYAGEQFEQNCAKRVDIGCSRDRLPTDLLRARVIGREHPDILRDGFGLTRAIENKQLRDSEIEQFWRAVSVHQNIAGFQITVDDEVAMRILHRIADLQE